MDYPKATYKPYVCTNCGHEKEIQTNHYLECYDYCKGCSWKPSFGKGSATFSEVKIPALGNQTYRKFKCTISEEEDNDK